MRSSAVLICVQRGIPVVLHRNSRSDASSSTIKRSCNVTALIVVKACLSASQVCIAVSPSVCPCLCQPRCRRAKKSRFARKPIKIRTQLSLLGTIEFCIAQRAIVYPHVVDKPAPPIRNIGAPSNSQRRPRANGSPIRGDPARDAID